MVKLRLNGGKDDQTIILGDGTVVARTVERRALALDGHAFTSMNIGQAIRVTRAFVSKSDLQKYWTVGSSMKLPQLHSSRLEPSSTVTSSLLRNRLLRNLRALGQSCPHVLYPFRKCHDHQASRHAVESPAHPHLSRPTVTTLHVKHGLFCSEMPFHGPNTSFTATHSSSNHSLYAPFPALTCASNPPTTSH